MEVTVECSKRLLEGDVSIVDTRRLFLKYSDGSSPVEKFRESFTTENVARVLRACSDKRRERGKKKKKRIDKRAKERVVKELYRPGFSFTSPA